MDKLTAERTLICKLIIDVSDVFFDMLAMDVYNQALADVRSTGAGIECLYYNITYQRINVFFMIWTHRESRTVLIISYNLHPRNEFEISYYLFICSHV